MKLECYVSVFFSIILFKLELLNALREFRSYSIRARCEMAKDANYPFAYSKYLGQKVESKSRVNSNLQDFRHECQVLGGQSKCNICEDIECLSDRNKTCSLQLQGVNSSFMSINIPGLSDTSWAINGSFRHDYGGSHVTHFCVFTSLANCTLPDQSDFTDCKVRCFGHGFKKPAKKLVAATKSVTDVYPGMGKWIDDGAVDLWAYPRNCAELEEYQDTACTYSGHQRQIPSFNPQGYTFTHAGSGTKGFLDGTTAIARFNAPEDVAVDDYGLVYVADTGNNAIRIVQLNGTVSTLAGLGPDMSGFNDGSCSKATFSQPKGLDIWHTTSSLGVRITTIIVADTGNHRIRRIVYTPSTGSCYVSCLTGLCGNNTLSASTLSQKAIPQPGYADGNSLEARFSAPQSVSFMENGKYFVVADTGNFLVRWVVTSNGTTSTLAGRIVDGPKDPDGNPLPGCTPPCMVGQPGFQDGNLSYAEFYNPLDVTRGPNNTVWVADEQRLRIIELPGIISDIYGIHSMGRVSTIAGNSLQGHDDGLAQDSTFFYTSGVFVTPDNIAYVVDAVTCRIRRVTPFPSVAETVSSCTTRGYDVVRPSGCTSFDQPIDKIGRKGSRVERNIQYNFGAPYTDDKERGKYIKNCVGIPPHDRLQKRFVNITGTNLVVDDHRTTVNEDSEEGMAVLVRCTNECTVSSSSSSNSTVFVQGTGWYSESSSICLAAIHDGKLISGKNGLLQLTFERRDYLTNNTYLEQHYAVGSTRHGITSTSIPESVSRVFSIDRFNESNSMVHTVAGMPSAPLESSCGFLNAQPSTATMFNLPSGIAARYNESLSDSVYLYIADTSNHRIRAISATCTQICENGGSCTGPDICTCTTGWTGVDCTKPICNNTCGINTVCVAPDHCACKPGFSGTACTTPQCVQTCYNGGSCTAPDTCTCAPGWFDTNCTTPVCDVTCANGGNCTAPGNCSCPAEWSGADCRTPLCTQTCLHDGFCVAPNTCICPPQYFGYDCSIPVCSQGYFQPNSIHAQNSLYSSDIVAVPIYKNCDLQSWCNATDEFECDQQNLVYQSLNVPFGPEYRAITGRKTAPNQCMRIELPTTFKVPFQLVYSDNTTTGNMRFSPLSPYTSNKANNWRGYLVPSDGHTGPWTYTPDRQVANVIWVNMSQGHFVCANGGTCIEPDVCSCASGWVGFDCRTPVCTQGYYKKEQTHYVTGLEYINTTVFKQFMGNNSYLLQWPYSNPNYTVQFEYYVNSTYVRRQLQDVRGIRYYGAINDSSDATASVHTDNGNVSLNLQGGYRCSIRADTQWENEHSVFEHPNFYSRYMDSMRQADNITYTFWKNLEWPPTHHKSRVLDRYAFNISYAFTNEGYRRLGTWNRTGNDWHFGVCILQFYRNCSTDPSKQYDLESDLYSVYVQDTDLSYRPRITYNDYKVNQRGRWNEATGICVDNVVRGCANNGTCVAPDQCRCAEGWQGFDCRVPICSQTCHHHGNCTNPNICTCQKGWSGDDCLIPLCAQECQNGGVCIAPDTCQCNQWPNTFVNGRVSGGRPLFQDYNGDALNTGWTGYDCSVPICVQAKQFVLNVASSSATGFTEFGGHGANGLLTCTDTGSVVPLPRCPMFDEYVTGNDGTSFQTGCGWDPFDTGCCIEFAESTVECYKCDSNIVSITNNTFFCGGDYTTLSGFTIEKEVFLEFLDANGNFKICGSYHAPRYYDPSVTPQGYGVAQYYEDVLLPAESSFNYLSNWTSNRFLCNVPTWIQGDYVDDAGFGSTTGIGSIYGLKYGRHARINTPNILYDASKDVYTRGPVIPGEGVYECYNSGSCIGPDACTCTDGYDGYDCATPLCRHLQVSGAVSSCLNGGICVSKDKCDCVQTNSVLWKLYPTASRGVTGWTGTDCSMPMCVQGYYDPFCSDLPQAPGGEGCYRCANNGNCTAPEVCTCAEGWTGYDCKTPVCEVVADPLTRVQLGTSYEDKVIAFESDPCGVESVYGLHGWKGTKYSRGNCTEPNQCICLCKIPYNRKSCHKTGELCNGPWQDDLVSMRNVLSTRGARYTFGSTNCYYGFEGNVDSLDRFTTCHQVIFRPTTLQNSSLQLIIGFAIGSFVFMVVYRLASVRLKRRFLLAKIERRRTRRDSEASMLSAERNSVSMGGAGDR